MGVGCEQPTRLQEPAAECAPTLTPHHPPLRTLAAARLPLVSRRPQDGPFCSVFPSPSLFSLQALGLHLKQPFIAVRVNETLMVIVRRPARGPRRRGQAPGQTNYQSSFRKKDNIRTDTERGNTLPQESKSPHNATPGPKRPSW